VTAIFDSHDVVCRKLADGKGRLPGLFPRRLLARAPSTIPRRRRWDAIASTEMDRDHAGMLRRRSVAADGRWRQPPAAQSRSRRWPSRRCRMANGPADRRRQVLLYPGHRFCDDAILALRTRDQILLDAFVIRWCRRDHIWAVPRRSRTGGPSAQRPHQNPDPVCRRPMWLTARRRPLRDEGDEIRRTAERKPGCARDLPAFSRQFHGFSHGQAAATGPTSRASEIGRVAEDAELTTTFSPTPGTTLRQAPHVGVPKPRRAQGGTKGGATRDGGYLFLCRSCTSLPKAYSLRFYSCLYSPYCPPPCLPLPSSLLLSIFTLPYFLPFFFLHLKTV